MKDKPSTSFKSSERNDGSGKTDTLFNREGDKGDHGHVVESGSDTGKTTYHYARDESGNVFADDSKDT